MGGTAMNTVCSILGINYNRSERADSRLSLSYVCRLGRTGSSIMGI